jgi:hypothetical protein
MIPLLLIKGKKERKFTRRKAAVVSAAENSLVPDRIYAKRASIPR